MEKKKRVLILWYMQGNNFGDFLLYQTVKERFINWGYEIDDMEVSSSWRSILERAESCDLLWFAGGGIIEREIPSIITRFEQFHKLWNCKPYGVTGLSIGSFDYSGYKEALGYWVSHGIAFYTRDLYSSLYLNKIAGKDCAVESSDVVFANSTINSIVPDSRAEIMTGLSFRDVPYKDLTGDLDWVRWERELLRLDHPALIPDESEDWKQLASFQRQEYSIENVIGVIKKCRFVVAMRFHVILAAALMGKVSIPIAYCPKVERLACQLGIQELVIGIHDYDKLEEKVNQYRYKQDEYKEVLLKNVLINKKRADNMFYEINNILKEKDL